MYFAFQILLQGHTFRTEALYCFRWFPFNPDAAFDSLSNIPSTNDRDGTPDPFWSQRAYIYRMGNSKPWKLMLDWSCFLDLKLGDDETFYKRRKSNESDLSDWSEYWWNDILNYDKLVCVECLLWIMTYISLFFWHIQVFNKVIH